MQRNDLIYCNFCCTSIFMQKHVKLQLPNTRGDKPEHYEHYHDRYSGDCFSKKVRQLQVLKEVVQ